MKNIFSLRLDLYFISLQKRYLSLYIVYTCSLFLMEYVYLQIFFLFVSFFFHSKIYDISLVHFKSVWKMFIFFNPFFDIGVDSYMLSWKVPSYKSLFFPRKKQRTNSIMFNNSRSMIIQTCNSFFDCDLFLYISYLFLSLLYSLLFMIFII